MVCLCLAGEPAVGSSRHTGLNDLYTHTRDVQLFPYTTIPYRAEYIRITAKFYLCIIIEDMRIPLVRLLRLVSPCGIRTPPPTKVLLIVACF